MRPERGAKFKWTRDSSETETQDLPVGTAGPGGRGACETMKDVGCGFPGQQEVTGPCP